MSFSQHNIFGGFRVFFLSFLFVFMYQAMTTLICFVLAFAFQRNSIDLYCIRNDLLYVTEHWLATTRTQQQQQQQKSYFVHVQYTTFVACKPFTMRLDHTTKRTYVQRLTANVFLLLFRWYIALVLFDRKKLDQRNGVVRCVVELKRQEKRDAKDQE